MKCKVLEMKERENNCIFNCAKSAEALVCFPLFLFTVGKTLNMVVFQCTTLFDFYKVTRNVAGNSYVNKY